MKCIPKLQGYFSFKEATAGSFNLNAWIWPVKYFLRSLARKKKLLFLTHYKNFIFSLTFKFISPLSPNIFASPVLNVKAKDKNQLKKNHSSAFRVSKSGLILYS